MNLTKEEKQYILSKLPTSWSQEANELGNKLKELRKKLSIEVEE